MTHVYTPNFQGLFKKIVFRSVALALKNLWSIKDFLHTPVFYRPAPYLMHKKIYKKILKIYIYEK